MKATLFTIILAASSFTLAQDAPAPKQEAQQEAKPAAAAAAEPQKDEKKPVEENISGSVEVGYRVLGGVSGNFNTYRTFVNLGEGPQLLHADFRILSPTHKYFDTITGFASGWGDPNNMARLSVYKETAYQLDFDYRNLVYYSFLPSYANPLLANGILLPQQAFDINRRNFDANLKIRPHSHITPYLSWDRNWGRGSGITNFVNNSSNEYAVYNAMLDRTDRYRGGARIEFPTFHFTVEQGGTTFKDDQNASTNNHNIGDRIGGPYFLDTLNQTYRVRGSSVFTQVIGSWTPFQWIGISGQFLYSRPELDTTLNENATGAFNVPGSLQYFSRYQDVLLSQASQPHNTGVYTVDIHPFKGIRILDSLILDTYRTTGLATLAELTPLPKPGAFADLLDYTFNRHQIEVMADINSWTTIRGGFRNVWGDATMRGPQVTGQVSESGQLSQQVLLLGFQMRPKGKLWINGDYERGTSTQAYFRTSLYDYSKGSLRARYQLTPKWNLSLNSLWLDNQNPTTGISLDYRYTQNGVSTLWTPTQKIHFLGDYYFTTLRSNINFVIPNDGASALSAYRDNAHSASASVELNLPKTKGGTLRFGGSMFRSSGSRPTAFYQPQARLQFPLRPRIALFGEWRFYDYGEPFYQFEQFRNMQFLAGLRFSR